MDQQKKMIMKPLHIKKAWKKLTAEQWLPSQSQGMDMGRAASS
jgi:hypothetical protein